MDMAKPNIRALHKAARSALVRADGARALEIEIDASGLSVPSWCDAHGLNQDQVRKALRGETPRISVDFAEEVQRATKGRVKWTLWRASTRKADPAPAACTGTDG